LQVDEEGGGALREQEFCVRRVQAVMEKDQEGKGGENTPE
jgi:hypothetical protein